MTKRKSTVTLVAARKAADTKLFTNGADAIPEDSFAGSYMTASSTNNTSIIEPTYKPGTLKYLCQQNNILGQCVDAMEVNVAGTGHKIVLPEGKAENEKEKSTLEEFFSEPYPGKSMVTIRREIDRDKEESGNGYMQVIRNAMDEVVMCNSLDSESMRCLRLDDPVYAEKTITRKGVEITVSVHTRERRFVQIINGKKTYFKEFGASRDLDKTTGLWAPEGKRLPIKDRASEVIHFTLTKEPKSPYGVPRWINQLPSVLGSRKAEEFNLEFFDAGGLPPVLVLVQGGYLGDEVKDALTAHLSGSKASKHRAAIVEATSSSGSLDSTGTVQIRVERFGSDRQKDAMFQEYDRNTGNHIRVSFRLPGLFLGMSEDYNFATALTSYMVAEAQVFAPERFEFDEVMNNTIVKALGAKDYRFQSLPISLADTATQIKAIELTLGKGVLLENSIDLLNQITGLKLEYDKDYVPPEVQAREDQLAADDADRQMQKEHMRQAGMPPKPKALVAVKNEGVERTTTLIHLANGWAGVLGITNDTIDGLDRNTIKKAVSALEGDDLRQFNEIMAAKSLSLSSVDLDGLAELCGCGGKLLAEA